MLYTSKLNLSKPEDNDGLSACRDNWDRLDYAFSKVIWVPAGTTPANDILFEGAVVAERDTGKIWRAERTPNGAFEKAWIKYPWLLSAYSDGPFGYSDTVDHEYGFYVFEPAKSINCIASDVVNNRVVIPINGLYAGVVMYTWGPQAGTGWRDVKMLYNRYAITDGTIDVNNSEIVEECNSRINNTGTCITRFNKPLKKGDTVSAVGFQNGAATVNLRSHISIACVRPT